MDDERIERALRQGPPDEPAYVPGTVGRLGLRSSASPPGTSPGFGVGRVGRGLEPLRPAGVRLRRAGTPIRRSLPVTIAAALALVVGGLFVSQTMVSGPAATPAPSLDLLARLRSTGSISIAVSNGPPQTVSAGGAYIGFDVAVADAIARELGLAGRVSALGTDGFSTADWDLALPGAMGAPLPGAIPSDPYAYWPTWLVTSSGSPVTDLASLASARVCVVRGSTGAAWLAGGSTGDGPPAPAGATAVEAASDDECGAALSDGRADAMVTATLLADELGPRGLHLVIPTPVVSEPWVAMVRTGDADTATLLDAVNRAIAKLRTSGRLESLSKTSFGGQDVTVRQP